MPNKPRNPMFEASPWSEHQEVVHYFSSEPRDPLESVLQSLWVRIEVIKRETAEGDLQFAQRARQDGQADYEKALSLIVDKETATGASLTAERRKLTELKADLDALNSGTK